MRTILFAAVLFAANAHAQVTGSSNSSTLGSGTGTSVSIDYFALATNPSNLGWQSRFYNHKLAFKVFDFSVLAATPVTPRYLYNSAMNGNIVNKTLVESFYSYKDGGAGFDTTFLLDDRYELRDLLTKQSSLRYNRILVGASYVTKSHGTFAVQISNQINGTIQLSERTANMLTLGKTNPYFDSLVLSTGEVIANNSSAYTNETLGKVVHAFSNDSLTIGEQLDGSYFKGMRTRNFSIGWGNGYKSFVPGWETFIGATLNIIQGQQFYDWESKDGEFYMRNAKDGIVENTLRMKNPGLGASVNLGLSFLKTEQLIVGVSINNLGFIRWKDQGESSTSEYNSVNDKNMFHYPFGTSKDMSFYDQWGESNMFIAASPIDNYEESGSFTSFTASTVNLGAQWKLNKAISFSSDVIVPLNPNAVGSIRSPYFSLGAQAATRVIGISVGVNNNFNKLNIPLGITFGSVYSALSFTVATNDFVVLFQDKGTRNNSLAVGMVWRLF